MKPLARFIGVALVGALALLAAPDAQAQGRVNITIGAPAWGPQVPYGTQYYYIPEIDGYYDLYTKSDFPLRCSSVSGATMPSSAWVNKIKQRYAQDYHPLLNAKSWIRFPIGVAYGITTFTLGLGVTIGGCAADLSAEANGQICKLAAAGGGAMMGASGDVVSYALKPDLRRWKKVPSAIYISRAESTDKDPCWAQLQGFTGVYTHDIDPLNDAGSAADLRHPKGLPPLSR